MQQNLIKNQTNSIEMRKRIIANFFFFCALFAFFLVAFRLLISLSLVNAKWECVHPFVIGICRRIVSIRYRCFCGRFCTNVTSKSMMSLKKIIDQFKFMLEQSTLKAIRRRSSSSCDSDKEKTVQFESVFTSTRSKCGKLYVFNTLYFARNIF